MSESNYVTQETFELMKVDLHRLKSVERPAASRAIAEAREKGDLKENAEYDAAKEAQGMLEAKIKYMEGVLATSKIVDTNTIDTSKVTILTKVTITNLLQILKIAAIDQSTIEQALSLPYKDFEDAVQMMAAVQCKADYLVTRNVKDFKPAPLSVIQPSELLSLI